MSVNLRCEGVPLRQTTTDETEEIFSPDPWGTPLGGWEGVAARYILWLEERRARSAKPPTPWYTDPEWVRWTEEIEAFRAEVDRAIREARPLRFYRR